MANVRKIRKVWKSRPTIEGAGVRLHRGFGFYQMPLLDPFLLLDDFHSNNPADYLNGFPWHPHRGIETITYVLQGKVDHGDSMGNAGSITSGDVQWMTAGSGIVHQEMPKGDESGRMWGFQLWANLPASHKMMPPRYRDVKDVQIPEVGLDNGVRARIISGQIQGVRGPVTDIVIEPEYLDISMPANSKFVHPGSRKNTVLAYVIEGEGCFDRQGAAYAYDVVAENYFDLKWSSVFGSESVILYGEGDEVVVVTEGSPVRFLLISGKPIGEPIAWHGPIVMNTPEELQIAFDEYKKGTFIKSPGLRPGLIS
jgi:redox-sensitive bicupin YhaK (pirin superfamily)